MEIKMVTDVQIDLYGETQYYLASAKQGDKATRYLRVQLMNNGTEYEIPEGAVLAANIRKPDGKFCWNECENEENRVMVQLTNQALAAAGTAYCDIEIRNQSGDLILSSAAFTIEIEQSMRDEEAIESCNEMTVLDKKIQAYIDSMMAARQTILSTEEAFKLAESARALNEADRIREENIRQENERQRIAAENQRQQQMTRMEQLGEETATSIQKMSIALSACEIATERAESLYRSEEKLEEVLQQVQEMKVGIAVTVDGGSPSSTDALVCDGGTPFTTEEIEVDCGTP